MKSNFDVFLFFCDLSNSGGFSLVFVKNGVGLYEACGGGESTYYKRNLVLKRALSSLQKQTYPNWRAILFDDSEEGEAEEVYKEFQSERIIYRKNPKNLGVAGNLYQAFLTKAYTQADFAFVLEYENVLYPKFIQKNIRAIFAFGYSIVRCDQEFGFKMPVITTKLRIRF